MTMQFSERLDSFLRDLCRFEHACSGGDRVWDVIFPDRRNRWSHIKIVKYRETYYLHHLDGPTCALEVVIRKSVEVSSGQGSSFHDDGRNEPAGVWEPLIEAARVWLRRVERHWIRASALVHRRYPLDRRSGIVPHALVRESLEDIFRIDLELGKARVRKFVALVESGYFHHEANTTRTSMSARTFFEYCRTAYLHGRRAGDPPIDEGSSGRDLYLRFADGRHEGLLEIDETSEREFADWIDGTHPKRSHGGHPWEIKRGGNTTHINLAVYRPRPGPEAGFRVELQGDSITRLNEAVRMFLAIHSASLPIAISDADGVRLRLLAQDNLGIVPIHETLHRANQLFPREDLVNDVIRYADLGRFRRRIAPFITWKPLPLLRPRR